MKKTVNIFLFGEKHTVPEDVTVMTAMEYAGYKLSDVGGCSGGFCGACAVVVKAYGDKVPKVCLACKTTVKDNMHITRLPNRQYEKKIYDVNSLHPTDEAMKELYPQIYSCIGCGACNTACPKGLDVMKYVEYAKLGDFKKCAEESFACVECGACMTRCPMGIPGPHAALLARRLTGKYLLPESKHLSSRVKEIENGEFDALIKELTEIPTEQIKELYDKRDIED